MSPAASDNTILHHLTYHALTHQGDHTGNEDDYTTERLPHGPYLFAIADGVGGLPDAHHASTTAITELRRILHDQPHDTLNEAVVAVNQLLLKKNKRRPQPMATTLVACLLNPTTSSTIIAHVGDSRAYILNNHLWHTKDHTSVQDLVDCGIITADQAFIHPYRNRLNQALGLIPALQIPIAAKTLTDTLLLCSDGLTAFVRDNEIAAIVKSKLPQAVCDSLIKKAIDNGSTDDITVICVKQR